MRFFARFKIWCSPQSIEGNARCVRQGIRSMKPLLDTAEAAPLCGQSVGTLENWRVQGVGPKFIKSGRKVLYDPDDIAEWRKSRRFQSTTEAESA